ncbi:MAG TPA: DoxX family protein [Vicinamibacterales bacterium]|nr:DoxX family protein [Vicinamibacterales bacterium]
MAIDRRGTGLTLLRVCLGVFFLFEGLSKVRWFGNSALLTNQLSGWADTAGAASWSGRYLSAVAIPYATYFARLVPLGEITCGIAMIIGVWTPLFAFIAFFMALNFQFASAALFKYSFLTSGYGLPVLGGTLALAIGGTRLPWSIHGGGSARATKAPRSS